MPSKDKNIPPMDAMRIRFIEVLDAIMRDNPKVRSVKHIARMIDTPYLGLHKVYNFHKHKTAFPSAWHLVSICKIFKTINPDYIITGEGDMYRDIETNGRLDNLEKELSQIKRILNLKHTLKRIS